MNNKLAIEQLKDLRESQREFINDKNNDSIFKKDVEALDLAIKALEGTAQEVPVEEQSKEVLFKDLENKTFKELENTTFS